MAQSLRAAYVAGGTEGIAMATAGNRNGGAVVVTGVSTGIGHAIAQLLTTRGFSVFGSVRKRADAERLHHELGATFVPLVFDVRDADAIERAARDVRARIGKTRLLGLVNNAGVGSNAPLLHQPIDDISAAIDVNLIGQLRVTQAFAPLLGTDDSLEGPPGRIVNISSIGGTVAAPFMGAYAASKRGLEAASDSLRTELLPFGVDVIVIAPGFFESSIRDSNPSDFARYDSTPFGAAYRRYAKIFDAGVAQAWPAEKLAELVATVLTTAKPKAHYFAGPPGKVAIWMMSRLPRRVRTVAAAKRFGVIDANPPK
jgi:NAD(P)-dependent dehydrogenase (short-subunit alcohol dehydrogenase family)